jgi:hypothetical protein
MIDGRYTVDESNVYRIQSDLNNKWYHTKTRPNRPKRPQVHI